MTYRELVYMCLDEIKLASDDSYITEDHILFLISKYRAFLLRQKYEKTNMPAPMSNYQLLNGNIEDLLPTNIFINLGVPIVHLTLTAELEPSSFTPVDSKTTTEVEPVATISVVQKATYVSPHRFEYVGNNRHLNSFTYCTLSSDRAMKFKNYPITTNNGVLSLQPKSFEIYAIFEDCVKASEFNLENGAGVLDCECPIESELVSGVQELVVKDALGMAYRPKDYINDGSDDLSQVSANASSNNN